MNSDVLHDFLDAYLPMASRWSTLTVKSFLDSDIYYTADAVLWDMFDCRDQAEMVFPQLQELRVKQYRSARHTGVNTWETEKFIPR